MQTSEPPDFTQLDDPAFLDERARVRELLEHEPEDAPARPELERAYEAMTAEFLSRARIAWTTSADEARRHPMTDISGGTSKTCSAGSAVVLTGRVPLAGFTYRSRTGGCGRSA